MVVIAVVVQSFSRVQLFSTLWTAARQAFLSITNSQSPPKLTFIESVMPSNHLILASPSPPAFNLSQHQCLCTLLQYSCLENSMDGGAWWTAVHGVAKSRTRLSNFTFTFHFHALEKEMAIHSSILAWRIRGMGEPSGLLSLGSHRVGHD